MTDTNNQERDDLWLKIEELIEEVHQPLAHSLSLRESSDVTREFF